MASENKSLVEDVGGGVWVVASTARGREGEPKQFKAPIRLIPSSGLYC